MTKQSFTPGPWEVEKVDNKTYIKGSYYIAEINNLEHYQPEAPEELNEMTKANTNLIAAAPDLLEALHVSLAIMKECGKQLNAIKEGGHARALQTRINIAEQAIAKAEGK